MLIAEIIAPATIIPKSGEFSLLKVMLFAILNVPYSASIYIMPKKRVNAHFPFPNLRWSDDLHPTIEQPVLASAFFNSCCLDFASNIILHATIPPCTSIVGITPNIVYQIALTSLIMRVKILLHPSNNLIL